ncbi:Adaptor protein complex AP-3 delta subunit [Punctularia strigosozonata HHB-11173 SS5]|uniref:Adaptor protein complex AP-3 delta subunit n=1 Tax=Punctularia strigosozonata (strain HHB-11173) TaxID=741275 RepID=UPI000441701A|nr:Adaptor protein complex AP-3 delta subunit [Punctularia strigosozonata HHB-11173 SS5]EIN14349.1 Adaptor protein complex AP-3 delta subunit [Punctularia strigosozonata HHB-11173 SS5]
MWERTLQDLIRGLRANKKDEAKFIAQAMDEIRKEVKSKDMELKAGAILKLTYLDMLGYDMSWASFHVVEVMSSPKIHLKSVGYLGAGQSFGPETDVLMLTTNLLKKDLSSLPGDVAIALNGLSDIVTPDLGRDLSHDLISMMNHSRAHIRKRAILALYKVFLQYPEARQQGMTRLREKLEDPDPGVVAATINVLCELARQNPADYLPLAPQLFHLLTSSSNNWMLIKIIKLFGALCPHEPRLVKKLQPPITDLITNTPAISLLYECVHTAIIGGMLHGHNGYSLARTCVTKLAAFLQDPDQNLKYIALLAMVKIVPTHPNLVAEHQDLILSSIDDEDISIRMRALDLVSAMVNSSNLQSIVQQLLSHLLKPDPIIPSAAQSLAHHVSGTPRAAQSPTKSPAYRLLLVQRILAIGSQSTYENVTDFEWYLSVLIDLAYVANVNIGSQIRDQLVDIAVRVRGARSFAVGLMVKLLSDDTFLRTADEEGSCAEVLWAAAWICGEYCSELSEAHKLLPFLLQPGLRKLSSETVAVYLQNASKVFGFWAADTAERWEDDDLPHAKSVVDSTISGIEEFVSSPDVEVQERAANIYQLLAFVRADLASYRIRPQEGFGAPEPSISADDATSGEPRFPKSLMLIGPLFSSYELNPVAPEAQASVPVPGGLDLDAWFVPPPRKEEHDAQGEDEAEIGTKVKKVKKSKGKGKEREGTSTRSVKKKRRIDAHGDVLTPAEPEVLTADEQAEMERKKAERLERLRDDPYYIMDGRPSTSKAQADGVDVDSIPVVRLDDLPVLLPPAQDNRLPALRSAALRSNPGSFVVDRHGEMPAGATPRSSTPRSTTPLTNESAFPPTPSAFQEYVVAGDIDVPRTPAPEAIKVTRAKKKSSTGKKRQKAAVKEGADGDSTPSSIK